MALKVLSRSLKELEADDFIIRTAYPKVPHASVIPSAVRVNLCGKLCIYRLTGAAKM